VSQVFRPFEMTPVGGEPMDIAFWIDSTLLAGEAAFVRHLVMGLKAEGQRVTFIAQQGLNLAELPTLGSRVLTYRWNRWEKFPVLQKLRLNAVGRQLNDNPPDVLVAWGSADVAPLAVASQVAPGIPMVLWCWDASELFSQTAQLKAVRHLIASSQMIADRMSAVRGGEGGGGAAGPGAEGGVLPVTVIHPGVYTEEATACFDVEGQMPCLVSLDPLSNRTAYEALFRACRMLVDKGMEFLLFAYDTGTAEHPIWMMAEKLGLLERMSFVPFQQDAEPLLLHGDLYIHIVPTARVQYRSLEAMGRGLAVVTCANHGADYLLDGQTCRVVGPQMPEAWRDVLLELLKDRGKAAAIARRGQQYVRERHTMARTLEQFGSICRQVSGLAIPLAGR